MPTPDTRLLHLARDFCRYLVFVWWDKISEGDSCFLMHLLLQSVEFAALPEPAAAPPGDLEGTPR